MAKIVVALLVLTLSTLAFTTSLCKRCGYVKKHTQFPPYSRELHEVVETTAKRLKVTISVGDLKIIDKIIARESGGDPLCYTHKCYGLGQGKKGTYKDLGIPWKTTCPSCQVEMLIKYIKKRYGTFPKAWRHHLGYHWY